MIEFKLPDFEPVEIDDSYHEIIATRRIGKRFLTNNIVAFDVLAPGSRRTRLLEAYNQEQARLLKVEPVIAQEPLRETVYYTEEVAEIANVSPPSVEVFQNDQEAVQDFLDVVTVDDSGDPWVPSPDQWFDCTVKDKLNNSYSAILELSNGQLVWCHERDFTVRNAGHSLCQKDAKAVVRIEKNRGTSRYEFRALECQLIVDGEEKESHTTGEITYWTGSLGSARMGCDCSVQIATASRYEELELAVGDRVEFDLVFSEKLQKFVGRNITVLAGRREEV